MSSSNGAMRMLGRINVYLVFFVNEPEVSDCGSCIKRDLKYQIKWWFCFHHRAEEEEASYQRYCISLSLFGR